MGFYYSLLPLVSISPQNHFGLPAVVPPSHSWSSVEVLFSQFLLSVLAVPSLEGSPQAAVWASASSSWLQRELSMCLGKHGFILRCIWNTFFLFSRASQICREKVSEGFFLQRWCGVFGQAIKPITKLWSRFNSLYPGLKQEFYQRN